MMDQLSNLPPITKEDIISWKEDLVTKHMIEHFNRVASYVKEARLNRDLISSQEGIYRANYLLGYSEAIDELLDFSIEEEN
jgi:hypothetical protein